MIRPLVRDCVCEFVPCHLLASHPACPLFPTLCFLRLALDKSAVMEIRWLNLVYLSVPSEDQKVLLIYVHGLNKKQNLGIHVSYVLLFYQIR